MSPSVLVISWHVTVTMITCTCQHWSCHQIINTFTMHKSQSQSHWIHWMIGLDWMRRGTSTALFSPEMSPSSFRSFHDMSLTLHDHSSWSTLIIMSSDLQHIHSGTAQVTLDSAPHCSSHSHSHQWPATSFSQKLYPLPLPVRTCQVRACQGSRSGPGGRNFVTSGVLQWKLCSFWATSVHRSASNIWSDKRLGRSNIFCWKLTRPIS